MSRDPAKTTEGLELPHDPHVVLRVIAKFLIPLIALFAFYVQFHGEYGPGGGFQAGVILSASIILYALSSALMRPNVPFRPGSSGSG